MIDLISESPDFLEFSQAEEEEEEEEEEGSY